MLDIPGDTKLIEVVDDDINKMESIMRTSNNLRCFI